jgi:shikimate kinase
MSTPGLGRRTGSVYLIGFMASGKATIGALLASELGRPFLDLDRLVEERAGRTIAELWAQEGEDVFRYLEGEALASVAGQPIVLATGGGTPLRPESRLLLERTGLVLWLRAPFELIWMRAKGERRGLRPLFKDEDSLRELYAAREPSYAFAHFAVEVSTIDPALAAADLAARIRSWEQA